MSEALPEGRISGPRDFEALLRQLVRVAAEQSWPQLCWYDTDFSSWPLGEQQVVDDLTRWSLGGGRLAMMARDFRPLMQLAPRFLTWRRQFDHCVEARVLSKAVPEEPALAVWAPPWALVAVDRPRRVFVATSEPAVRAQRRQEWDSAWPLATVGFPASVLGL
jgi:hypothetical protein